MGDGNNCCWDATHSHIVSPYCCGGAYPNCNVAGNTCDSVDGLHSIPAMAPVKAEPEATHVEQPKHSPAELAEESGTCGDGTYFCSDGNNCCWDATHSHIVSPYCCGGAYPNCNVAGNTCDSVDGLHSIQAMET